MTGLALVFVEEVAEGRMPRWESEEAQEYRRQRESEQERAKLVESVVRESCIKVYGPYYYLLGSLI